MSTDRILSITRHLLCIVTTVILSSTLSAQSNFDQDKQSNWHQWRGPNADGMAGTGGSPPANWSEDENIAWKVAIAGEGSSTPIIWQDRVYLIAAVETDQKPENPVQPHPESKTSPTGNIFEFRAICLERSSGKEIWNRVLAQAAPHEGRHPSTTYASASPTTDGQNLYVSFGSYGVFCLTLDGDVVWERDLGDMRTRRGWGEAVSPVVAGEKLIVMWDQEDQSRIFALNTSDGSTAWESTRDEPTTWATPIVARFEAGATQVITAGTNLIRSYELKSGDLIWQTEGLTLNAIPCPVINNNHVILMSGYRGNAAVSLDLSDGNLSQPEVDWKINRDTPYVPSPLLTNGRLYFTKSNNAILSCVDSTTGEPVFDLQRLPELRALYASPVASNDYIYFPSREGKTLVIKNSDRFETVSVNSLDDGIDASPAIAGNQLFLRTRTHLYCIAAPQEEEPAKEIQEDSVKPGINTDFLDPNLDVDAFVKRFEMESREVFANRAAILASCELENGMVVADVGAGTGLFSMLFARAIGSQGQVYAVDIAPNFLSHIREQATQRGLKNVTPVLCSEDSVSLAANSVDLVFTCDTYHHFEFPMSTMNSIHKALRKDGRLVIVDFERIEGKTRPWLLNHVRAGKKVVRSEIEAAGFRLVEEKKDIGLDENYLLIFEKK